MKTFLSEEPDFKELLIRLEALNDIPDDKVITEMIQEINEEIEEENGKK